MHLRRALCCVRSSTQFTVNKTEFAYFCTEPSVFAQRNLGKWLVDPPNLMGTLPFGQFSDEHVQFAIKCKLRLEGLRIATREKALR